MSTNTLPDTVTAARELQALKGMVKLLWNRVRVMEMIVIRDADGEQTRKLLHGIRESLYATCDYYSQEPLDRFREMFEAQLASQDQNTDTDQSL